MKNIYIIISVLIFLAASQAGFSQTKTISPKLTKIAWTDGNSGWISFKPQVNISGNKVFMVYKSAFGLTDQDEMKLIRQEKDKLGYTHYRYQQIHKGISVDGAVYLIHEKDGKAKTANGKIVSGLNISGKAAILPSQALNKAMLEIPSEKYVWQDNESETMIKQLKKDINATNYPVPELVVFDKKFSGNPDQYRLAYKIEIYSLQPLKREFVYIDANTGLVLHRINMIQNTDVNGIGVTKYNGNQAIRIDSTGPGAFRLREVLRGSGNGVRTKSAQNQQDYSLSVEVTDDSTFFNSDDIAVNAHWAAEMTYDYYLNIFGRNSFDDQGATLLSYVHYSQNYSNAFWDGQRMTYGDGDGSYSAFTSLEICGHEITHAVTEHTANLVYQDESGALSECFSDIFGTSIEFYVDTNPDWLMGEDISTTPLRSMIDPNSTQNPDTYLGTYWDEDIYGMDNGGVHTNCGVGNYWFYLLTEGGSGTNDNGDAFSVTGIGHLSAESIAYRTLSYYLTPSSDYYDAYQGSLQAAKEIFGECSNEAYQTANAWYAVGVGFSYDPLKVYVVDMSAPRTSCGLGLETVSALLFYNGCDTSLYAGDTISMAYQFDGGSKVYQNYILTSNWNGGDSLSVDFTTSVDASVVGVHTLNCWVKYGSGITGFTDSLMGYSFSTLLQQNIDVGVVGFTSPISSCSLTNDEAVGIKICFYGCDSLIMGDTIDVAYRNSGGTPVTEQFVLPANMYPTDTFVYVFNQTLNAVTDGTYTLDAWTEFGVDTLNSNDMFSGYLVKNTAALGYDTLTFSEINAMDYLLLQTKRFSNINFKTLTGNKVLQMTGGNAFLYYMLIEFPSGFNTWLINEFLSAKTNFCVDALTWNSAYLKFNLKQTHGGNTYVMLAGETVDYYRVASNLRILADGNQIGGTYNPTTPGADPFVTHLVNLSNYAGSDFVLTFETRNIAKDTLIYTLDNAYLDNVHFFPGPLAIDDTATVQNDTLITLPVVDNDNNHGISALKFSILTSPLHGTYTLNADTTITYEPDSLFQGYDSLTYRICYTSDTTVCDEAVIRFHVVQDQGIHENIGEEIISLFPNPVKSDLTIKFVSSKNNKTMICISDVIGKTLIETEEILIAGTNQRIFSLENEPAGVYFVKISTNGSSKVFKITKK